MMSPFVYGQDNVKDARLAGSWYPGDRAELVRMLDGFFAGVAADKDIPPAGDAGVIVSPHAGYPFSGPVAAYGFKAAQAKKVSTVIILAPRIFAEYCCSLGDLCFSESPLEFPKMRFYLLWHDRSHRSEECRWFRDLIAGVIREKVGNKSENAVEAKPTAKPVTRQRVLA